MRVICGEASIADVEATLDRIGDIADEHGVAAQAFDARCVADPAHLVLATRCALRARAHDDTIADDLAVELLCYAAGRRQIGEALALGIESGEGPVAVVVVDPERDPSTLWPPGEDTTPTPCEQDAATTLADRLDILDHPARVADALRAASDPERLQRTFDIAYAERAATDAPLPALVRERTALLAVTK